MDRRGRTPAGSDTSDTTVPTRRRRAACSFSSLPRAQLENRRFATAEPPPTRSSVVLPAVAPMSRMRRTRERRRPRRSRRLVLVAFDEEGPLLIRIARAGHVAYFDRHPAVVI